MGVSPPGHCGVKHVLHSLAARNHLNSTHRTAPHLASSPSAAVSSAGCIIENESGLFLNSCITTNTLWRDRNNCIIQIPYTAINRNSNLKIREFAKSIGGALLAYQHACNEHAALVSKEFASDCVAAGICGRSACACRAVASTRRSKWHASVTKSLLKKSILLMYHSYARSTCTHRCASTSSHTNST
jgi:hypothetical protein